VKGRDQPISFEREYTPHGVVVGNDRERHLAFALRWSGNEPGGAAELGALALNRARSAAEFRDALSRWKMPSVEVVYAERGGGIGSGIAAHVPVRIGWDGRLPAAGWLGGTEWTGWRTRDELSPGADRGERGAGDTGGYVASANGNRARTERLRSVLGSGTLSSVEAFERLQHDVRAWNAERLLPLFQRLRLERADVEEARQQLLAWNREVTANSAGATLYVAWERLARRMLVASRVPAALVDELVLRTPNLLVPALTAPSRVWFDGDVSRARDRLIIQALEAAVTERTGAAGVPPGRAEAEMVVLAHPLAITDAARPRFNVGPFERPRYADMLMATSGQRPESIVGASFAAVFDLADWDRSVAQNAPGQSESPTSTHFADLAKLWSEQKYFPLLFSEGAVAAAAESTLTLAPQRSTQNPQNPQNTK
jgi:penicillin amidase